MIGDERRRAIVAGEGDLAQSVATAIAAEGFVVERAGFDLAGDGEAGGIDLIVALPITGLEIEDVADLAEQAWIERAERPLDDMRRLLASASGRLRDPGGAVAILLPNIGMVGLAGTTAQTMAAEGIRSLAKSVSKAWRHRDIRVNCVIVSATQLAGAGEATARGIAGIAAGTAAAGFVATGNSILIDGEQTSV